MRSLPSLIGAIVGLGWITSLAAAPNLSMSDYQVALRRGRQAVSESAFIDALTQFEAALRARPNDPVALSELGWAALQAGDLARARTATESANASSRGAEAPLHGGNTLARWVDASTPWLLVSAGSRVGMARKVGGLGCGGSR